MNTVWLDNIIDNYLEPSQNSSGQYLVKHCGFHLSYFFEALANGKSIEDLTGPYHKDNKNYANMRKSLWGILDLCARQFHCKDIFSGNKNSKIKHTGYIRASLSHCEEYNPKHVTRVKGNKVLLTKVFDNLAEGGRLSDYYRYEDNGQTANEIKNILLLWSKQFSTPNLF